MKRAATHNNLNIQMAKTETIPNQHQPGESSAPLLCSPLPHTSALLLALHKEFYGEEPAHADAFRVLPHVVKVLEAATCIRHWHDSCGDEGMVVSKEHVFKLWEALKRLPENGKTNDRVLSANDNTEL